jgi:hypothetical protein
MNFHPNELREMTDADLATILEAMGKLALTKNRVALDLYSRSVPRRSHCLPPTSWPSPEQIEKLQAIWHECRDDILAEAVARGHKPWGCRFDRAQRVKG